MLTRELLTISHVYTALTQGSTLLFCMLLAGEPVFADGDDVDTADPWHECRAGRNCWIEFDHLSKQKTEPFLFSGFPVNDEHPQWRAYKRSLRRFDDVRDCLDAKEAANPRPNLLHFDWQRIGFGSGVEVCVFRIVQSLGTTERTEKWLKYHDFRVETYAFEARKDAPRQRVRQRIEGHWTIEQYRSVKPSTFVKVTGIELLLGYSLNIGFGADGELVSVSSNSSSK